MTPMTTDPTKAHAREAGASRASVDGVRDLSLLGIGSAVAGVLAYVVFALTTRGLGAVAAAPVAMLWTIWSLTTAAIGFPLQHWVTQSATSVGHTGAVRRAMPAVSGAVVALTLLIVGVSWLLADPLFNERGPTFPVLAGVLTLSTALAGVIRGGLSVEHRYAAVAATLVLENAFRCVGVAVLLAAGVESPAAYGVVIALGNLTGLPWAGVLRFHRVDGAGGSGGRELGQLLGVSVGQMLGQGVLTGGPAVLAVVGGSPAAVTVLFIGLSLYRAPYILATGMVARLTGWFTAAVVARETERLRRVHRALAAATVVATVAAAAFGATVGRWLIPAIFGPDADIDALPSAILAAGSTLAVSGVVLTVMLIAHGRGGRATIVWLIALVPAVPLLVVPLDPLVRVCWAFLAAQAVAWVVLLAATAGER